MPATSRMRLAATAASLILATSILATSAHAVFLNERGLGQVLVFPYYTVNGGHATLLSIVNTTAHGKAVKVRFREGYDGRPVLDFNLYLGPHDSWVGAVGNRVGDSVAPASLTTTDTSCTVPAFAALPGAASVRYVDFSMASYAGENAQSGPTGNADGGPTGADRTREGHFEIFEMGEVVDTSRATLHAITAVDGTPPGCAQLVAAWAPGGYWNANAATDIAAPGGGLSGAESMIDVEQGTLYGGNAEAIDGFSVAAQHTAPGAAAPDFDSASRSADGTVAAFVAVDGRMRELDYLNPVDAISALFMSDALYNEFSTEATLNAHTDWVVTAPTKHFYVDPKYVGLTALAPFQRAFEQGYTSATLTSTSGQILDQWASSFPYACDTVGATAYSRGGAAFAVARLDSGGSAIPGSGPILSSQALTPCLETSVLTFSAAETRPGGEPISVLGSHLTDASDPGGHVSKAVDEVNAIPFDAGDLRLDLLHDLSGNVISTHRLAAATNGDVLLGLPVIGFVAQDFINGNVTPQVLANYSGLYSHRASVACTNASTAQNVCP